METNKKSVELVEDVGLSEEAVVEEKVTDGVNGEVEDVEAEAENLSSKVEEEVTSLRESEKWKSAEALRKAGKFEEAKPIFLKLFEENRDASSLWRAVHCARKLKLYEEALDLIEDNKSLVNSSGALLTQFNWLRYEFLLDSYKKKSDWQRAIDLCEELLEDCPDETDLFFRLVLFSGIDAAKKLDDYEKVLEFTGIISPSKLPREGEYIRGKKIMSYQERWYYARIGALYEVSLYEECEEMVEEALKEFPRCIEFARKGAQCKIKLGKKEAGVKELNSLCRRKGCPWYISMELANLRFELGKYDEALQAAYVGANGYGELKNKVNLIALIAKIQLVLGNSESAKNHVALACTIRDKQGWRINKDFQRLMDRFGVVKGEVVLEVALRPCEKEWRDSAEKRFQNSADIDENKKVAMGVKGRLGAIVDGRPFAFISRKNKKESIYVRLKDIPKQFRKEGLEVVFDMVESFDRMKSKKSVRAINVQKLD